MRSNFRQLPIRRRLRPEEKDVDRKKSKKIKKVKDAHRIDQDVAQTQNLKESESIEWPKNEETTAYQNLMDW